MGPGNVLSCASRRFGMWRTSLLQVKQLSLSAAILLGCAHSDVALLMGLQATARLAATYRRHCCRQTHGEPKEVQSAAHRWGLLCNLEMHSEHASASNETMLLQLLKCIAIPQQHVHRSSKATA